MSGHPVYEIQSFPPPYSPSITTKNNPAHGLLKFLRILPILQDQGRLIAIPIGELLEDLAMHSGMIRLVSVFAALTIAASCTQGYKPNSYRGQLGQTGAQPQDATASDQANAQQSA